METLILGWYVLVETRSVLMLTVFASLLYIGTLLAPMFGVTGDRIAVLSRGGGSKHEHKAHYTKDQLEQMSAVYNFFDLNGTTGFNSIIARLR